MDERKTRILAEHLRGGRPGECFSEAEAALAADSNDLVALAYRGIAHGLLGDEAHSLADLSTAAERAEAQNQVVVAAFAFHYLGKALCDRGQLEAGYSYLERAVKLGNADGELFTALCQTANRLGHTDTAQQWGEKALQAKDHEAHCKPEEQVARKRPLTFDPSARKRNIIAYSLFGKDTFYHECAITTARQVCFVYPEFTARFYCSQDVPDRVLRALAATGAEIKTAEKRPDPIFGALLWRLLAFDDPEVHVVLVRDVDSPILPRERAAIDTWLRAEEPFHVIRDDVQHTAPIMAGLWGGFAGVLPKMREPAFAYARVDSTRYCDQRFLRWFVWPRIREATLGIDSVYSFGNTVRFPSIFPKYGSHHVGGGWTRKQILGHGGTSQM